MKKIITYNGTEAYASDCRKIAGQYYIIGKLNERNSGQCYVYDGVYYRENSEKLKWDFELQSYNLTVNMVKGYTDEGLGYFTRNIRENFSAHDGLFVFRQESVKPNKLYWDYLKGYYSLLPSAGRPTHMPRKPTYQTLNTETYSLTDYDVSNIEKEFNKYEFTEHMFDKYLHNYIYGLEIETDAGWFPENLYYKLGAVPLKDGSINGTEITTLLYPPNINLMEELFTATGTFCEANQNNSLHVNISGFKNTAEFRVALYIFYYRLQQEILAFTPLYKRDLQYFQEKKGGPKDHCKPMESLNIVRKFKTATMKQEIAEADKTIFRFLNEGVYDSTCNLETRRHIRQGNNKWDHQNRYYALNLMPMYFGNMANSRVEYRLHSGTVNKYKALIWILLCAAITKFVENNSTRILLGVDKITLDDVLYETIIREDNDEERFLLEYITEYINRRRDANTKYVMRHNGSIYGDEFSKDSSFAFEIHGASLFNYASKKSKSNSKRT